MQATELHLFDFDGTLFHSPDPPPGYTGSWGADPAALDPPNVPRIPDDSWWNAEVVEAAREAIASPYVRAGLLTGRPDPIFRARVQELLAHKGLDFEFALCNPFDKAGTTMPWKRAFILGMLDEDPALEHVVLWDDDMRKIPDYVKALRARGIEPEVHHIDEPSHELASVARLAAQWLRRVAKEFPSEKARKQYLRDHPKADPKNHSVSKGDKPKGEDDAPKGFVNKLKAKAKAMKEGLAKELKESKEMFGTFGRIVSGGEVSEKERSEAKDQAVDVLKGVVSAAMGVVPGGSLLFALTAAVNKVFKKDFSWAPSAFQEKAASDQSPEGVAGKLLDAVLKEMASAPKGRAARVAALWIRRAATR